MKLQKFLLATGTAVFITGCQSNAEFFQNKRLEEVKKYFDQQQSRAVPTSKVFTLDECIQLALENNLDLKLEKAKKDISQEGYTTALLGMLPKLNGSYDVMIRDELSVSKSNNIDGSTNDSFNYSSEKKTTTLKLEAVFSIVDFGMAYYNAQQAEDRISFNNELVNRTRQNLAYEIAQAYYEVAVSQTVMTEANELLRKNDEMESRLDLLSEERTVAPMQAVSTGIDLLSVKQRLKDYKRNYNNSCIRLSNLMGYTSTNAAELQVATDVLTSVPHYKLPDIQTIETLALENRPELIQSDINAHIAVVETRKAIISMFPNVQITSSINKTDNPFTKYNVWRQVGMNAVVDFFDLPSKYYEYKIKNLEESMMDERTLNLSIGIISQVNMAHVNIAESLERYQLSAKIYELGQKKLALTRDKQQREGAISTMALLQTETQTHLYNIARLNDLSAVHVSYNRLINSVGTTDLNQTPKSLDPAYNTVEVEEVVEVIAKTPVIEEIVEAEEQNTSFFGLFSSSDAVETTEELVVETPVEEVIEEIVEAEEQNTSFFGLFSSSDAVETTEEFVVEEVVVAETPVIEVTETIAQIDEEIETLEASRSPWYDFWSSDADTSEISVEDLENEVNSWTEDMN